MHEQEKRERENVCLSEIGNTPELFTFFVVYIFVQKNLYKKLFTKVRDRQYAVVFIFLDVQIPALALSCTLLLCVCVCISVCACVCVCVCERERDHERDSVCV